MLIKFYEKIEQNERQLRKIYEEKNKIDRKLAALNTNIHYQELVKNTEDLKKNI